MPPDRSPRTRAGKSPAADASSPVLPDSEGQLARETQEEVIARHVRAFLLSDYWSNHRLPGDRVIVVPMIHPDERA